MICYKCARKRMAGKEVGECESCQDLNTPWHTRAMDRLRSAVRTQESMELDAMIAEASKCQ